MLDEQDIQRLAQVFATKAELEAAVSNLATKNDINELLTAIDAYANKADTYFQEYKDRRQGMASAMPQDSPMNLGFSP